MKRIFDPIHQFIELSDGEVALLDTAPMQRLRRLRQLGLAYLAYPSAEHSRFSHALGAVAIGERAMNELRRRSGEYFSSDADFEAQRRLVRASLLLHDIGHGPFSHACEAVLGVRHEARTSAILALPEIARAIERLDVDRDDVAALIEAKGRTRYPVLRELVSGPNLDADRMDYLLRDAYFTGVAGGRYDGDQLVASLCVIESNGEARLGVDGRGIVALESFVLARYMMFARVYFHHTTRMFERTLQEALRDLWRDPRALDPIAEYLEWDDFRVLDTFRAHGSEAGTALRERTKLYALAAEFNAERDLDVFDACLHALRDRYGADVWADEQEQVLHRLPLIGGAGPQLLVRSRNGVTDAVNASDIIKRLAGNAHWRKIFVRARSSETVEAARAVCRRIIASGPLLA